MTQFSPRSFGLHYIISLESSKSFQWPFILKQIVRLRDKIALWRLTSEPSSIINKITGHNNSWWLNSPITMHRMLALGTHLVSSTVAITFVPLTKKTSIFTLSQNQQTNYQSSSKSWWLSTERTFSMYKSFKSKTTTSIQSLEAMLWVIKYSWIANISKLCGIKNFRLNSLNFFGYSIRWVSKLIK